MLTYPEFDPVALALGPVRIRWYGLMYVLGFLAAWWLGRRRAAGPQSSWRAVDVDDLIYYLVFGVILGGRIGWLLFYGHEALAADPSYWYKIYQGGMSFHGGLIGVALALALFAHRRGRALGDVYDFTAPLTPIGMLTGRIGNFINGELWGKPTTLPWGFAVPQPDGSHPVLHPSQLYEAGLEGLLLFAIVWGYTARPRPRWAPTGVFLVGYASVRILIEFVRVPDTQLGYLAAGWLTMGMLLSLPMLLGGLALLLIGYRAATPSGNTVASGR